VARREYIEERHGNITNGKLTAIDIIKPIFIISLERHCEKLVRIFPENKIKVNSYFNRMGKLTT